jgi:hypothetical protein
MTTKTGKESEMMTRKKKSKRERERERERTGSWMHERKSGSEMTVVH